jgi:hypothetical protein
LHDHMPNAYGPASACARSPTHTNASGMPSEPPDADPHVRWCGGRRGEPGAYPINPPINPTPGVLGPWILRATALLAGLDSPAGACV